MAPAMPYNKGTQDKRSMPDLQDLRFEYDEYLLEWIDCGDEPMSFEEFVAAYA